mmetsp:Transcript_26487/g.36442  ORF Transcript_26487/g.36442 Transcript_26487/m.36442 type:complete len:225 (-) Transcript_26487:387-1061(-)
MSRSCSRNMYTFTTSSNSHPPGSRRDICLPNSVTSDPPAPAGALTTGAVAEAVHAELIRAKSSSTEIGCVMRSWSRSATDSAVVAVCSGNLESGTVIRVVQRGDRNRPTLPSVAALSSHSLLVRDPLVFHGRSFNGKETTWSSPKLTLDLFPWGRSPLSVILCNPRSIWDRRHATSARPPTINLPSSAMKSRTLFGMRLGRPFLRSWQSWACSTTSGLTPGPQL